ncbi:FAD-binding oxidoreductase [Micromonospora sp. NPDC049903]|uniref:FAD-binding oxidoreductase n=1 Tax=Micromonospora sp. NPDC049903 TaxID=3364276 RepID=UPI00378F05FD
MISRRTMLRVGGSLALATAAVGAGGSAVAGGLPWWRLRHLLQGDLVLPADAGYDYARQLQIAQYDAIRPAAVAYCETPADVRACLRFTQDHGVSLRVRSGGHNLAGWSTGPGLVVDLSRINHVGVGASTVRLGSGVQSIDALTALAARGRQIVTGTCPTVCAGGFITGGGVGWQTRKFGLGSDRMVSAGVVLADGRYVRASSREEPDLFWALRGGGGGNFGVVVDYEVQPIAAPTLVRYTAVWPGERAETLLAEWTAWCAAAPHELGSSLLLVPPVDGGGAEMVLITGVHLGARAGLDRAFAELTERAGEPPLSLVVNESAYAEAMKQSYGCESLTVDQCHRVGYNPSAVLPRTGFQRQAYRLAAAPLTARAAARVVAAWRRGLDAGMHQWLQCMALGGAAAERSPHGTAWAHRDAAFLIGAQVGVDDPTPPADRVAAAEAWTQGVAAALAGVSSGAYINFPSSVMPADWARLHYGRNYERLRRVKRQYDPHGVFTHPYSIR